MSSSHLDIPKIDSGKNPKNKNWTSPFKGFSRLMLNFIIVLFNTVLMYMDSYVTLFLVKHFHQIRNDC